MKKYYRILITLIISLLFSILSSVVNAQSSYEESELSEIKGLLYQYFDLIYESKQKNELQDLSSLLDLTSKHNLDEIEKLELEVYANSRNNLYFDSYNYSLDFSNIFIDTKKFTAQINVEERNEVIFNISKLANQENPIVSGTRIFHEFHFIKEKTGWKIESDIYDDDLWIILNSNNMSFSKIKTNVDEYITYESLSKSVLMDNQSLLLSGYCPDLRADSTSHDYNRENAAEYAVRFAYDSNPSYYEFPSDCTNFVSQAIKHGGNSRMAYPPYAYQGDPGSMGWYYTDQNDYAAAWTWVDGLYSFITEESAMYSYDDGPEGCVLTNQSYLNLGDIVQFDDEDDEFPEGVWNHSVMVTDILYLGFGEKEYFISSHSSDHRDYPLAYLLPYYDDVRYIRIDRIDGLYQALIPMSLKNYSSGYTLSQIPQNSTSLNSAYPAPGAESVISSTETSRSAYP